MTFTVAYANNKLVSYKNDDDHYDVLPSGILVVWALDRVFHFSPSGWLSVEDDMPALAAAPPQSGDEDYDTPV